MYDHYVDWEGCENLNYLMKKENEKSEVKITEKEDIIANMTKETVGLKKKNNDLAEEVKTSKSKDHKTLTENRKLTNENKELKDVIKAFPTENQNLKSKVANKELEKMVETESQSKKAYEENGSLRAKLEKEKDAMNKIDDKIKMKDEEIRSLVLSKRIKVENETKLQKNNHLLQKEVQELKMKYKTSSTDGELLYPCDKCTSTFKTAGLLIKHVKS